MLDPFHGSGRTAVAALSRSRSYVGIDLFRDVIDLSFADPEWKLVWDASVEVIR